MIVRLNKELLKTANCVTVGTITTLLAGEIKQRFPNIDIPEGNIVFWRNRIKHLEKHKYDFMSDMLFEKCFEDIPLILQHPDFLCIKKMAQAFLLSKNILRMFAWLYALILKINTLSGLCIL